MGKKTRLNDVVVCVIDKGDRDPFLETQPFDNFEQVIYAGMPSETAFSLIVEIGTKDRGRERYVVSGSRQIYLPLDKDGITIRGNRVSFLEINPNYLVTETEPGQDQKD